jgi:CubicO group peptidase (beta-lactamase class C family)
MSKHRKLKWPLLIVCGVAVVPAFVLGLWAYTALTAETYHPNPKDVTSVSGEAPPEKWAGAAEQARQLVRASLAEQNLPGFSVAVGIAADGSSGEIVWAEGFGWADLVNKTPVKPDTRFRIGTASTALTSAAVGLLLEKGRLKLDDEIQTYVPEFPKKQWPVTLRQLMGHTAGLRNDGGDEGPLMEAHCKRPIDALQYFSDKPLLSEPGTKYHYSSYGWILLSAAIEAAAGEPFLTFMENQVFEPLGMNETKADSVAAPAAGRASSYFPRFAADPKYGLDPMREIDYSCYSGSSAFVSTASDLVRFAMAVNGHRSQSSGAQVGAFLQPATVQLLQTSQRLPSGEETGYGLGWDLESVQFGGAQTTTVGHDGDSLGGMVASLVTFPKHGIVVAVLSNSSYADTAGVAVKVAQAFAR